MHELDHYIYPHRVLHWLVAAVIVLSLASGAILGTLGFERAVALVGQGITNALYTAHKTLGVGLLILMTLRIITRLTFVVPDHEPPLNAFERVVSTSVHHLLYLALVAMPLLGWWATAAGGFPVQFFQWTLPPVFAENSALSETLFIWHGYLGWAILALTVLHIAGALYHWRIKRDNVMKRMSLFE